MKLKGVLIVMKKFLSFLIAATLVLSSAVSVLADKTVNKVGIREYEQTKGNNVKWNENTKIITVYDDSEFLYSVSIGDSTVNMKDFLLQLDYNIEAENGVAYIEKSTLDFINDMLEKNKSYDKAGLYKIVEKSYESEDKNIVINYPQIENYKGELLQSYMNQSISQIVKKYSQNSIYKSLSLDYSIERSDEKYISILFTGEAKTTLFNDTVKIMDSVTMELDSSQVLTVENYIKDKEKLFDILKNSTLKPLEYESLKFYFEDENIVFYYMPSDDSNREYNAIELNLSELENIIHEYIGEKPAS